MQNHVNDDCRHPSAKDIDDIMGLNIHGGHTHQDVEWHHAPEEPSVTQSPGKEQQDGRYAYMTAGEGCRGTLACCMGILYHVIEEPVAPSGHGQWLLVVKEIMAHIWEDTSSDIFQSYGLIIVLRTCDRQEDEDDIVDEERRENDERRTVELLIAEE